MKEEQAKGGRSTCVSGLIAVASLASVFAPANIRAEPAQPTASVAEAHPEFANQLLGFLATGPKADLDRLQAAASEAGLESQQSDGPDGRQLVILLDAGKNQESVQALLDRMQGREFAALKIKSAVAPSSEDAAGIEPPVLKGSLSSYVSPNDYPAESLRAGEEGDVRVRLKVGVKGRVEECSVTQSSGSKHLDAATCKIYSRLRYSPARNKEGEPVVAFVSQRHRWGLPR